MINQDATATQQRPQTEAHFSLGELLRQGREKANLSQEALANRLKLTSQRINEIEQDNYSNMPGMMYVRGYIQSFARAVNVPVESIMQRFDELGLQDGNAGSFQQYIFQEPINANRHLVRWTSLAIAFIMVVLLTWWWRSVHTVNTSATVVTDTQVQTPQQTVANSADVVPLKPQQQSDDHLSDNALATILTE